MTKILFIFCATISFSLPCLAQEESAGEIHLASLESSELSAEIRSFVDRQFVSVEGCRETLKKVNEAKIAVPGINVMKYFQFFLDLANEDPSVESVGTVGTGAAGITIATARAKLVAHLVEKIRNNAQFARYRALFLRLRTLGNISDLPQAEEALRKIAKERIEALMKAQAAPDGIYYRKTLGNKTTILGSNEWAALSNEEKAFYALVDKSDHATLKSVVLEGKIAVFDEHVIKAEINAFKGKEFMKHIKAGSLAGAAGSGLMFLVEYYNLKEALIRSHPERLRVVLPWRADQICLDYFQVPFEQLTDQKKSIVKEIKRYAAGGLAQLKKSELEKLLKTPKLGSTQKVPRNRGKQPASSNR